MNKHCLTGTGTLLSLCGGQEKKLAGGPPNRFQSQYPDRALPARTILTLPAGLELNFSRCQNARIHSIKLIRAVSALITKPTTQDAIRIRYDGSHYLMHDLLHNEKIKTLQEGHDYAKVEPSPSFSARSWGITRSV